MMPSLEIVRPSDWFLVPRIHCFSWLRWILTFFTDFISCNISFAIVDRYSRLSLCIALFVTLSSSEYSTLFFSLSYLFCCSHSLCLMRSMVCWLNLSKVLIGWSLLPNALRPFKIYCASTFPFASNLCLPLGALVLMIVHKPDFPHWVERLLM